MVYSKDLINKMAGKEEKKALESKLLRLQQALIMEKAKPDNMTEL